jgi:hypothetical protein
VRRPVIFFGHPFVFDVWLVAGAENVTSNLSWVNAASRSKVPVRCLDQEPFQASNVIGVIFRGRLTDAVRGTFEVSNARMFDGIALINRLLHPATSEMWSVVRSSSFDHGVDLFVLRSR